jgi:hypothetical protein
MTKPNGPYTGSQITFATMHGKEQLANTVFGEILGASVTATPGMDTDQFGTFAGEIERTLSPRAAARAKARLGMQLAGTSLGLASEGSFSSGFMPIVENMEILLFIDDARGLELVEGTLGTSPVPGGRRVHSTAQALDYASAIGYPDQGVVVQSTAHDTMTAHKNLIRREQLEATVEELLADGASVVLLPDYRAHKSPSRAETIATLCNQMARRLATPCPHCDTPGFGQVDVEHGVPCALCGDPTQVIGADIHGCGRCEHRSRVSRGTATADPQWCDSCNP